MAVPPLRGMYQFFIKYNLLQQVGLFVLFTQSYNDQLESKKRWADLYKNIFGYIVGSMTVVAIIFVTVHWFVVKRTRVQVAAKSKD